jgi:hypothetical protein
MASRVRGRAQVRSLLKRLPESVRQEIVRELDRAGREILPVMQSRAPVRTGATRAGLSYRVLRGSLRLLVGLISTPLGRAKLFYARIQDLGRREQTVTAHRLSSSQRATWYANAVLPRWNSAKKWKLSRKPTELGEVYEMHVRAMVAKRFVTGSFRPFRQRMFGNLAKIWARAVERAASGATGSD